MLIKRSLLEELKFIVILLIVWTIITGLYVFAGVFWYGYLIIISVILILILLSHTKYWKGIITLLSLVLAIAISIGGLSYARPETDVSLTGVIARESIRTLMPLPAFGEDGLFSSVSDMADAKSLWRAPKGYTLETYNIDGLPIEVLIDNNVNSDKVILQLHGGGYVNGYNDIYRGFALRYSKLSGGATVVSIDYRLAPQHQFPAALEDAIKAWDWLLERGYLEENIIVVGDSAGGNLTLVLSAWLRDKGRTLPKAMVLMSPWTDMAGQGESYVTNQDKDPLFGQANGRINYYAGNNCLYNPYLSPIYGELNGFPPMLIQVGTHEILESDSISLYNKAILSGVNAKLTRYEGMFHVFQLSGDLIPESRKAWNEVGEYLVHHFN